MSKTKPPSPPETSTLADMLSHLVNVAVSPVRADTTSLKEYCDAVVGYIMLTFPTQYESERDAERLAAENLMLLAGYYGPRHQQRVIEVFPYWFALAQERGPHRWRKLT